MTNQYASIATCREILAIQRKQLKEWESVLKPEVYAKVEEDILAQTERVGDDMDKPFFVGRGEERYNIPRGNYISEAVSRQMVKE